MGTGLIEAEPNSVACARCGGSADWIYADQERTRVEVRCPDCGSFTMTRAELDVAETDLSGEEV